MSDVKYPITGSVWFRKSTQEWVLELEGSINGTYFIDRHTEPSTTLPEDVPGLPSLYGKLEKAEVINGLLTVVAILNDPNDGRFPEAVDLAERFSATLATIKGDKP